MAKNDIIPTAAELEILQILWRSQPATVRFVHELLAAKKPIGYTTTLKQFQRMTEKGMLKKINAGKAHKYETIVQPDIVQKTLYDKLLHSAFNGSTTALVLHALGDKKTSAEELEVLEQYIQQMKNASDE